MNDVADRLRALRAQPILVEAASLGLITEVKCAMDVCLGDREVFDVVPSRKSPWRPSVDRFPVMSRDGGQYVPNNVRLAHLRCNESHGGSVGGPIGGRVTGGPNNFPREANIRGGQNGRSSHDDASKSGSIGCCQRWNINRGKSCTCGQHVEEARRGKNR